MGRYRNLYNEVTRDRLEQHPVLCSLIFCFCQYTSQYIKYNKYLVSVVLVGLITFLLLRNLSRVLLFSIRDFHPGSFVKVILGNQNWRFDVKSHNNKNFYKYEIQSKESLLEPLVTRFVSYLEGFKTYSDIKRDFIQTQNTRTDAISEIFTNNST